MAGFWRRQVYNSEILNAFRPISSKDCYRAGTTWNEARLEAKDKGCLTNNNTPGKRNARLVEMFTAVDFNITQYRTENIRYYDYETEKYVDQFDVSASFERMALRMMVENIPNFVKGRADALAIKGVCADILDFKVDLYVLRHELTLRGMPNLFEDTVATMRSMVNGDAPHVAMANAAGLPATPVFSAENMMQERLARRVMAEVASVPTGKPRVGLIKSGLAEVAAFMDVSSNPITQGLSDLSTDVKAKLAESSWGQFWAGRKSAHEKKKLGEPLPMFS